MYRQYAPTLKSTIGNDLTGQFTNGVAYDWTDRGRPTYSGVFSATRSQMQQGYATSWYNLSEVRFSGSSGMRSLLHLKPRHIKGGNHSHSRGTIGNDLTGSAQAKCLTTSMTSEISSSGVFSWQEASLGGGEHNGHSKVFSLRFSGSSGFTGSVLEWPALYSQPCHLCSLDHSRGTIGNDLTGRVALIAPEWIACSGVFSVESSGSWKYADGGYYTAGALRFSGSSG